MEKNLRRIFIISAIFLVTGCSFFGERSEVNTEDNTFGNENKTSKELKAMNNYSVPEHVDTCSNREGKIFKVLIVGNSLSYHGKAKEIGWNHISGMAASSQEKDYAHLIFKMLEEKLPDRRICLRIYPVATFERDPETFKPDNLNNLVVLNPDIIVFQLGENVGVKGKDEKLFKEKYVELIELFKENNNPLTICTTPFLSSLSKNNMVKTVAMETNSFLTDLSHLPLLDSANYAKNEEDYAGDKSVWREEGIGIHPGDYGMENIADQIFITINAALMRDKIIK